MARHVYALPTGQGAAIPAGIIVMWSGLLANIPSGWALYDGTGGTPDLRDRFIVGPSPGEEPGGTGGSLTKSHSGAGVQDHPALPHSGGAVADHPATATSQASAGATQRGTTASTLTLLTHTHNTPVLSHSVTQPADHPAQAHVVTQPSDHADIRPPYYKLAFIIKL